MLRRIPGKLVRGVWIGAIMLAAGCGSDPIAPVVPGVQETPDNPGTLLAIIAGRPHADVGSAVIAPHLTWASDGSELFFLQIRASGFAISGVPIGGGNVRDLYATGGSFDPEPQYLQRPDQSANLYFLVNPAASPQQGLVTEVWRVDPRASTAPELVAAPSFRSFSRLAVSGDARWLALRSSFPTDEFHVFDTSTQTWRSFPVQEEPLGFSPDGSLLLTRGLTVIPVAGAAAQDLPFPPPTSALGQNSLNDYVFRWADSSPQFVLLDQAGNGTDGLSILDAHTGNLRQIAVFPHLNWIANCFGPCRRPTGSIAADGRKLALWSRIADPAATNPRHQIHVVDLETGAARVVATITGDLNGDIAFSPDGRSLAYFVDLRLYLVTGV